ncbi:hypothetical protein INT43_006113 [Umbelopsis isabellina]|uniref:BRISC and BRCA1-A complex member 2 n=1 Tax=Mortierella isabellina TaxID=91625 RepID=A0A8H7PKU1_MORIS|nr:hypothetical protein INT43_006113 [Umbelopsis isabellina]
MRTSPLYSLLKESINYLTQKNVNGISISSSKTSHPSYDSDYGCDRFDICVECCGQNIECQIIFDPYDWQFAPDIILPATLDTTFDIEQVAADDWDIRDRTCLFKYIMQLRELFIHEETKRLTSEHPDQAPQVVNHLIPPSKTYSVASTPEPSSLQLPYSATPSEASPIPVNELRRDLFDALTKSFKTQLLECDVWYHMSITLYVNVRIPEHIWVSLKSELQILSDRIGVPVDKRMGNVATAVVHIQLDDESVRSVDLNIVSATNFETVTSAEPKTMQVKCRFDASVSAQEKVAHIKKAIIHNVPKLHASLPSPPPYEVDLVSDL